MKRLLLLQLPIPQLNLGRQTGNIPLGAACLKEALAALPSIETTFVPESMASYIGDAALLAYIIGLRPDVIGFTVYTWNVRRCLYFARMLKEAYGPRIVFGGPEVTDDNALIQSQAVDFTVYGDGELILKRLLSDEALWSRQSACQAADAIFTKAISPYTRGWMEPWIEKLVLLETQRGCPYTCGYCFYGKARKGLCHRDEALVLDEIRWAYESGMAELYLLDPSLNIRPGLNDLLVKIAEINKDRRLKIISEIRAEAVDDVAADRFAAAGFTWLEIGLQSTNPRALSVMQRPTDLARFLQGVNRLKQRGILPGIDLIVGLPGDDLDGFGRSVDFIAAHGLGNDVQVFPLAILPGTDFRKNAGNLGLEYEPEPPYTVLATPTFSGEEILLALDHAETRLDTVLYPPPELELAWRQAQRKGQAIVIDHTIRINGNDYISKIVLACRRPMAEMAKVARRLTHPYQVFIFDDAANDGYLERLLSLLTTENPFTPLELVFMEPARPPDTGRLLEAARLLRPNYLDNDLRFCFPKPGNRAILFTLVASHRRMVFGGDMQRQVFRWQRSTLPEFDDLEALADLDGILIDGDSKRETILAWQDRMAPRGDDIPMISFSHIPYQLRWMHLVLEDDYWLDLLH
jgi:radical SAM superfamily enzyme YgiQ (UPF0313 family)